MVRRPFILRKYFPLFIMITYQKYSNMLVNIGVVAKRLNVDSQFVWSFNKIRTPTWNIIKHKRGWLQILFQNIQLVNNGLLIIPWIFDGVLEELCLLFSCMLLLSARSRSRLENTSRFENGRCSSAETSSNAQELFPEPRKIPGEIFLENYR